MNGYLCGYLSIGIRMMDDDGSSSNLWPAMAVEKAPFTANDMAHLQVGTS